jgi:hypothetical protein
LIAGGHLLRQLDHFRRRVRARLAGLDLDRRVGKDSEDSVAGYI